MFFSRLFPRGVFTRSWLDWQLDRAMVSEAEVTTSGGFMPGVVLYNNATDGRNLAVIALLAWCSISYLTLRAWRATGIAGLTLAGTPQPMISYAAIQPGQTYTQQLAANPSAPILFRLLGDGKTWVERAGAPLELITPGNNLVISATDQPDGTIVRPSSLAVSFVWVPV